MLFCNCNKSDKGQRVQYSDDPYWLDKFFSIQNNNNRQIESGWTPSLDTCSVYRIFWNFQKQYNTDLLYIWYHQFFRWYCKLGIDNCFENLKTLRTWMRNDSLIHETIVDKTIQYFSYYHRIYSLQLLFTLFEYFLFLLF